MLDTLLQASMSSSEATPTEIKRRRVVKYVSNEANEHFNKTFVMGQGTFIKFSRCEVYPIDTGRLGNHMFGYVTTHLLSREFNKQGCITNFKNRVLRHLFPNVRLPIVTGVDVKGFYNAVAFKLKLGTNDLTKFSLAEDPHSVYMIEDVPKPINFIDLFADDVRNDIFKLGENFTRRATKYFDHLRKDVYKKDNLTFVGLHIRLSDKGSALADLTQGGQMLLPREIRFLVEEADRSLKQMGETNLVYVLATEHSDWCRQYLNFTGFRVTYVEEYHKNLVGIQIRLPYFDFAILAHCNHSINNDGGTFSFWASYLADGHTFQPWDFYNQTRRLEMSQQLARANLSKFHNVVLPPRVEQEGDAQVKKAMQFEGGPEAKVKSKPAELHVKRIIKPERIYDY